MAKLQDEQKFPSSFFVSQEVFLVRKLLFPCL